MEFKIAQTIDFDVEELAGAALEIVSDYLYDNEQNYELLNARQKDMLLAAIFSEAIKILEEEG